MVRSVVEGGLSKAAAARQFNTTPKTVAKWVERFRAEGIDGLRDRLVRPLIRCQAKQRLPRVLPSRLCAGSATQASRLPQRSACLRRPSAGSCGGSASTGSRREPAEPVRRYDASTPGEIIHIDIKKLGRFEQIGHRITGDRKGQSNSRGVGWEYLHLAIDDHSRVAYSEILPDEKRALLPALSLSTRCASSGPWRQGPARHDRQRTSASDPVATPRHCACSKSSTCAPNPTRQKPMARPSASSKPRCANGPTPKLTSPQITAPSTCTAGCIDITGIGRTAV